MKKNRNSWDREQYASFSENFMEGQVDSDEMSDAEAGWMLGYSDYWVNKGFLICVSVAPRILLVQIKFP